MISDRPMPGNPWPHDMVVRVADDAHVLLELLWIREAWSLPIPLDDPPPLERMPTPEREAPPGGTDAWTAEWPALWEACLAHAAEPRDPTVFERLQRRTKDQEERRTLLAQLSGPTWRDRFGPVRLPDAYDEWATHEFELRRRGRSGSPEHRAVQALVPAWRAGLTEIVVIPCAGTYSRRVGRHGLLLTAATRNDGPAFEEALAGFARG